MYASIATTVSDGRTSQKEDGCLPIPRAVAVTDREFGSRDGAQPRTQLSLSFGHKLHRHRAAELLLGREREDFNPVLLQIERDELIAQVGKLQRESSVGTMIHHNR